MEDLYRKYSELLVECQKLRHQNLDLETKISELEAACKLSDVNRDRSAEENFLIGKHYELIEENANLRAKISDYELRLSSAGKPPTTLDDSDRVVLNRTIIENGELKENIEKSKVESSRAEILGEQNNLLKAKLSESTARSEELERKLKDFRKTVLGLLGYDIQIRDDQIRLFSLYAFDSDDVFVFKRDGKDLELQSNDFAKGWIKQIEFYCEHGRSIPAFLSSVTIELHAKKTFA